MGVRFGAWGAARSVDDGLRARTQGVRGLMLIACSSVLAGVRFLSPAGRQRHFAYSAKKTETCGKMRFWKTESDDAFLILKSFEKLRPYFRKERGHMVGFISNLAPLLNYLRRKLI